MGTSAVSQATCIRETLTPLRYLGVRSTATIPDCPKSPTANANAVVDAAAKKETRIETGKFHIVCARVLLLYASKVDLHCMSHADLLSVHHPTRPLVRLPFSEISNGIQQRPSPSSYQASHRLGRGECVMHTSRECIG